MVGMLPELANKIVLWPRLASFQGPSKHMQTNAVLTFISKPLGAAEGRDHRKPLLVEVWRAMHGGVPDPSWDIYNTSCTEGQGRGGQKTVRARGPASFVAMTGKLYQ